jgi:DNA-directed RNA polymerase specialized sigma24 family protein
MNALADLVIAAQSGNVEAYGRLVHATQTMALRRCVQSAEGFDAAQDAVSTPTCARSGVLDDLQDAATFAGWLRRIVITTALNMRRSRRWTFLSLDEVRMFQVLDEAGDAVVRGAAAFGWRTRCSR